MRGDLNGDSSSHRQTDAVTDVQTSGISEHQGDPVYALPNVSPLQFIIIANLSHSQHLKCIELTKIVHVQLSMALKQWYPPQ